MEWMKRYKEMWTKTRDTLVRLGARSDELADTPNLRDFDNWRNDAFGTSGSCVETFKALRFSTEAMSALMDVAIVGGWAVVTDTSFEGFEYAFFPTQTHFPERTSDALVSVSTGTSSAAHNNCGKRRSRARRSWMKGRAMCDT